MASGLKSTPLFKFMRQIIYYVAASLDGFIAGPNEDASAFVQSGDGVDHYLKELKDFDTVIMGRKTYEFGYQYGLKPGKAAYPHMKHYIFSDTLSFEEQDEQVFVIKRDVTEIEALKKEEGSPIYLCGGGLFAGWLMENQLIDILKVKLNPILLGDGIKLFGPSKKFYQLKVIESQSFSDGIQLVTYQISYP